MGKADKELVRATASACERTGVAAAEGTAATEAEWLGDEGNGRAMNELAECSVREAGFSTAAAADALLAEAAVGLEANPASGILEPAVTCG